MKKVLIITTGGTIACGKGEGLTPENGGETLISGLKLTANTDILDLYAVDSTDSEPKYFRMLYNAVSEKLPFYDGIVVLHGTDTLAYTSAFLALTIKSEKPIAVTGSMLSLVEEGSDGFKNISDAVSFASGEEKGVFTVIGGRIIGGADAIKLKSLETDAFRSYRGASETEVFPLPDENKPFPKVIKLTPFSTEADFEVGECCGVVIESFGAGGIPTRFSDALKKLTERTKVVITTPCLGGTDLNRYEVGKLAQECGATEWGCSTECAVVRMWLEG